MTRKDNTRPLIYALSEQLGSMKFHPQTGNLLNKKKILRSIGSLYGIDASIMEHIQILKSPAGFQYGVHGCPIEDLLLPFWSEQALNTLRKHAFPQLTIEMLFSVVCGIHSIINSIRLDIRYDERRQDDRHWYFQKTCGGAP